MVDKIKEGYEEEVKKVQLVFLLAKVYNTKSNTLDYLRNSEEYNCLSLPK